MPVTVRLGPGREKPIAQGHPWVFSGAVASELGGPGAVARVEAADGSLLGIGLWNPESRIRVRMLSRTEIAVDRDFFRRRLASALERRRWFLPPETTGYRAVNAEGDFLPSWTLDRFGDVLVSQITSSGLEALRAEAYAALAEFFPSAAIVQSNDLPVRRREGLATEDETIAGQPGAEAAFLESGIAFTAELAGGQKTGFYCDQRDNRRLAETLAAERRVLDLFAHSGAFSLYALRGGARSVSAVESSARLVERGRRHLAANDFAADRVTWVEANVFEDLRQREEMYDLVVCDPPPLVKRRSDLEAGARAYKDLNRLALRRLAPGGVLLTFSCSAAVDARLFRQILFAAAVEAERRVTLLRPLAAAPDHPNDLAHLEGEYLKGWLAAVD
ncbi:MAG: class I SAM-dependent rRNA methyltransferase [Thermoanaerobaculia bacterium]